MKRIFNVPIAIIIITVLFLACHQNRSATGIKAQKIKSVLKKETKADTLIFQDDALSALVQQTYKYFSIFDTISPNGGNYNVKKLKLNKPELDTLYSYAGDSISIDTLNGFEITGGLSAMIQANLVKILGWENIDKYDLSLLFKNSLNVTKSPDGSLYCFSFDEKTGGTYRSQISLIHYNPGSNTPSKTFVTREDSVFNSDGYDSIDTIRTKQGIKYLMMGSVVGCTTCIGNYIDLVHFGKGAFVSDFTYNVSTRSNYQGDSDNSPIIQYNAKLHRINIDYITNDMAPVCNCGKNGVIKDEPGVSYENNGSEDRVNCIYAFNGKTFVLKRTREKSMESSK